jgi:hypothetical protein
MVQWGKGRDTFVEQWLDRAHARVGMETALDKIVMDEVGQRQETHALMISHIRSYDHPALAPTAWLPMEVNRFVIAVIVQKPCSGQSF